MMTADIPLISRDAAETRGNDESKQIATKEQSTVQSKTREAWRFTVASGVLSGSIILLINIITLAVISSKHRWIDHSVVFYTGSCSTAEGITLGAHLIINGLCTVLLAYSNFSMQCLSSPTRKEVDSAHQRHQSLSIGTPSIRNLFFVSRTKAALWILLGVSSFPLHMIWNSTVFRTQNSYDYLAVSVTENFFNGANWSLPSVSADKWEADPRHVNGWTSEAIRGVVRDLQKDAIEEKLERLDVTDCIKSYHTDVLSDRRHVLLVRENGSDYTDFQKIWAEPEGANSSVGKIFHASNPIGTGRSQQAPLYAWMCDSIQEDASVSDDHPCPISSFTPGDWFPTVQWKSWQDGQTDSIGSGQFGWNTYGRVRYCYSQRMPERCKVSLIPTFLIVVIACNVVKIATCAISLYVTETGNDQPLCTTGDAIQSFLKQPDLYTQGRCLAAKEDYSRWWRRSKEWVPRPATVGDIWTGGRYRWLKAVSKWQWALYTVITALFILGIMASGPSVSFSMNLEMTAPLKENRLGDRTMDVLSGYLLGNITQLVISYVYLALNNILSNMLAMAEWCKYAIDNPRKGLRVSSPARNTAQRSKYFLSVPFKWAIPCTLALTMLHWIVSQALYFANLDIYQVRFGDATKVHTLGYLHRSELAILISSCVGGTIVLVVIIVSLVRKFPANIPLSGCCSASIAAACHPARVTSGSDASQCEFDPDLAYQKLNWGVVERADESADGIGHATFTAEEVTALIEEELYA